MKFKIQVDETRSFRHEFLIEIDSEKELDSILDKVESKRMFGVNDKYFSWYV